MNKEVFMPEIVTSAFPDMGQDMGEIPPLRGSDAFQDSGTSVPDAPEGQNGRESIKVLVRIRPLLPQETGPVAVDVGHEGNVIRVNGNTPHRQLQCSYDAAIGPEVSQKGVFSHVQECTSAVLEGENSTIFAYGQTGSGKTYTMFGPDLDARRDPPAGSQGIIPLAVADLFTRLTSSGNGGEAESSVWVSLVQLYNEQLYDMLRDPQRQHPLSIHEQPQAGIYVQGLSEYAVHSAEECLQLLKIGREHRAIRETHMNQASSRSHSIFQIVVEQKRRSARDGERILRSKFNLVDLAGSEKWDIKQEMEEIRVSEMTNINVSLYTLGRVIAALSAPIQKGDGRAERSRQPHIPYRDSKLTRLLQDSLGGNTRTRIIATLSPAHQCLDETISTLRFADRAKQVMAFVRVNEHRPVDHALVQRLQAEIKHLRSLLNKTMPRHEPDKEDSDRPAALTAMAEAQLLGYQETIEQLRRENTALRENSNATAVVEKVSERQLGLDVAALQAANNALEGAIEHIVGNIRRFFRFEIEEEDLHADLTRLMAHLRGSVRSVNWGDDPRASRVSLGYAATALLRPPRGNDKHGSTPLELTHGEEMGNADPSSKAVESTLWRGGDNVRHRQHQQEQIRGEQASPRPHVSLPAVAGAAGRGEPRTEKLAYRVRGKHADELVEVMEKEITEEEEERQLRRELKLAKERMKKNLQLQEWLLQKEQRDMDVLASESAKQTEIDRDRRRKDDDFRRRAAKQKAKLKRFYEAAHTEARKEAERRDHELLHGQNHAITLAASSPHNDGNDPI